MMKTTLRSHIYIVNSSVYFALGFVLLFAQGCAHPSAKSGNDLKPSQLSTVDANKDGKPDGWKRYEPNTDKNAAPLLASEDIDLNFDGKIDIRKLYKGGTLDKASIDLDFDGVPDREETYENGKLKTAEISHTFSKKKDTWKFYENGVLLHVEKDTNADGKPDEWVYYDQQTVQRMGKDFNFDGTVDTWTEMNNKTPQKTP